MIYQYEQMFCTKPREYISLLEKADQPEINTSEELDQSGINSMGNLAWLL
jgi:hypothetical protein